MSLIKWAGKDIWEPFHDLADLQEDMNRLVARGWLAKPPAWPGNGGKWLPEVDITEEKDHILVKADIPGMKQEDISVEVENDILTIRGERKQETEKKEEQVHRIERSYG